MHHDVFCCHCTHSFFTRLLFNVQLKHILMQPKIGHTEEIEYREEMRKLDQQVLAKKRLASRFNLETMENPMSNFNSKLV